MSVWVTIPSARPKAQVEAWAARWIERGYQIALQRDPGQCIAEPGITCFVRPYAGYSEAVNFLVRAIGELSLTADWFVIGGDDGHPEPNKVADEIAAECSQHFEGTFGVMQPTGDRWGENPNHPNPAMRSAYIDRVAGSAWLGQAFCRRANHGRGPLWPEYQHMFVDEELRAVAVKLGIYWERPDLTHHHAHAGRVPNYTSEMIPEHLKKWNTREHWRQAETIFRARRAAGFPGSEPL